VQKIAERDLVTVDPLTWHQFHADADSALGFLCLVSKERDKPQLPGEAERHALPDPSGRGGASA
jgi:hypothetical protein